MAHQHAPTGSLLELAHVAARTSTYAIVDHISCAKYEAPSFAPSGDASSALLLPPDPIELPHATYYLAGVNDRQRQIYNEHCTERYAQRSAYHYSSREDVEAKADAGGSMWRARRLHEVRRAFVGLDGLVAQPPEEAANGVVPDVAAVGRIFTFERLPGFNGLARLLLALERLGLATIAADGASVALRPMDLTPAYFAAARRAQGAALPEERGIENVHAFTYAKTFNSTVDSGSGVEGAVPDAAVSEDDANATAASGLSAHQCLFVLEQFWTVNYWHWTTDALPKALIFKDVIHGHLSACRLLAYDFPWVRQYLSLLGLEGAETTVFIRPRTLYFACRVLVPSPSALDAANHAQLMALRAAILPPASAALAAAAAAAGVGTRRPLVLLHFRPTEDGSVHGAGRSLTNLQELHEAMRVAFGVRRSGETSPEVVLFDHRGFSVAEQAALYSRAAVVVGVHGAGFANVLWAAPGTHIVEIVPVDVHLDFQCGLTPFWHASELLGLRKHAFIAYSGRMFEPFELPVVEFIAFLRASGILS